MDLSLDAVVGEFVRSVESGDLLKGGKSKEDVVYRLYQLIEIYSITQQGIRANFIKRTRSDSGKADDF